MLSITMVDVPDLIVLTFMHVWNVQVYYILSQVVQSWVIKVLLKIGNCNLIDNHANHFIDLLDQI
jgi:hypothetical protein